MMKSLNKQEGGQYYRQLEIQPAEYIIKNKLTWTEGNVVKYVTRHGEKGEGVKDLLKAIHYIEMILESEYNVDPEGNPYEIIKKSDNIVMGKATWTDKALEVLDQTISSEEAKKQIMDYVEKNPLPPVQPGSDLKTGYQWQRYFECEVGTSATTSQMCVLMSKDEFVDFCIKHGATHITTELGSLIHKKQLKQIKILEEHNQIKKQVKSILDETAEEMESELKERRGLAGAKAESDIINR